MTNPFQYLNAINDTKQNIMVDDIAEKGYNSFMVNRGLSYFKDTVLFANEMNRHHQLDSRLQFDFLINIIRKNKRYSKWYKPQPEDDVTAVMEYYGYSQDKARSVVDLLTQDQIKKITRSQSKGGLNDNDCRSND